MIGILSEGRYGGYILDGELPVDFGGALAVTSTNLGISVSCLLITAGTRREILDRRNDHTEGALRRLAASSFDKLWCNNHCSGS